MSGCVVYSAPAAVAAVVVDRGDDGDATLKECIEYDVSIKNSHQSKHTIRY